MRTGRLSEEGETERDLSRLATSLEPYTKYGIYASYFEGEANIEFRKNLVVLELEELKAKKDLQAVVMQLMMLVNRHQSFTCNLVNLSLYL